LYTGYPVFPGENEQEQLACIMEIFGPPSRDIIEKCSRRKLFFDSTLKPRVTVSSKGRRRRPSSKTLSAAIKCEDDAFLDFLTQCLRWDPERRLRPDQAMTHPFITNEPMRKQEKPRVRTTMAAPQNGPVAVLGSIPSPVKRAGTGSAAVSTSAMGVSAQTPSKEARTRPLPETPSTVVRNGIPVRPQDIASSQSPNKAIAAKRQSSVGPANMASNSLRGASLAVAGSKRASSGVLLQQQAGYTLPSSGSLPRINSGKMDMAGAAARESMGVSAGATRWR